MADARITGYNYVGGIVGYVYGTVENCRVGSDVTIHAVANGASAHGGVVGDYDGGTIRGCVSSAILTVADGLNEIYAYGGIVGGFKGNMSECLALGAIVPAVSGDYGAIAGYVYTSQGTRTNNYHRDCTVGGNAAPSDANNVSAYTISAGTDVNVAPAGTAAQTYDYNGIKRYGNALYYGGVLYAPEAANVSLTLGYGSVPTGLTLEYTPTAGTISGTGNPYTLTMPNEDVTINAALSVNYIAADGSKQTCYNPTVIQSGTTAYGSSANDEKWYVVLPGEVTINGYLDIYDQSAHLILCDGATLTVTCNSYSAIYCSHSITIYGQSGGTGTLNATTTQSSQNGIRTDGNLTINGGIVNATSKDYQGIWADGGNVTINGGTVTATAGEGSWSYGIKAYKSSNVGGNVTINGGTVNATGSSHGIYAGGTITLGWTNATDRITASRYTNPITVKTGQTLTDGSAAYSGTVDESALANKTLWPDLWDVAGGNDGSTAAKAYTITTTGGLDLLAAQVNNGNEFDSKFFRLGDDITYSHKADNEEGAATENNYTAIGGHINDNWRYFCGTFDGQGHTVSGIRIYKGGATSADCYQGLFGEAWGATIKNVILADARITGYSPVGGIAGYIKGLVENCRVGSDVIIHAVAHGATVHGGVVGSCNGGTILGCVSAATLTVADGLNEIHNYGGIVGGFSGNMSDCLTIGATVPAVANRYDAIAGYVYDSTQTNCYFRDCTVGDNTHQSNAYTIRAGTDVNVAPAADVSPAQTYDYNGIQRYGSFDDGNVLYYGGLLYVPTTDAGANFSLTLGYTANAESYRGFTASAGTLSGTENPYTLTIPAEDVTIDGRLKKAITITTENLWCLYDGTPKTISADPVTALNGEHWNVTSPTSPVLEDGDNITLTFPSITEVGSIENRPTVVIRNSNNEDVTANYNITFNCGTLNVRYYQVTLYDYGQDGENSKEMDNAHPYPKVNAQLQSRILYIDGDWNTLCLPFSLSAAQIADSPLAGADIRTLSNASLAGGVLTLNFTPAAPAEGAVTSIEAGVPYLIKWTKPEPYIPYNGSNPDDCSDIYAPLFQGVTISEDMHPVHCDFTNLGSGYYMEFMGTYSTICWQRERNVLFLGAKNTLYYPADDNGSQIGAFRAYFQFSWSPTADVRAFNLDFSNGDDADGIGSLTPAPSPKRGEESWYDLNGRKLAGKPTQKGIYIHNGRKEAIE